MAPPPKAHISPLSNSECGRGARVTPERLGEIELYCARAVASGASQDDLRLALNASRSRVSRWCRSGLAKHGIPTDHRFLKNRVRRSLPQMMWARIDVRSPGECWPWRGVVKSNGYGSLNYHGKAFNAHRLVYETLIAPIPDGLVLDHICQNKCCCNPAHLQAVTQSANVMLAVARRAA